MKRKNTVVYLSRFVIIFLSVIAQALAAWFLLYTLQEKFLAVNVFLIRSLSFYREQGSGGGL